jgi:hypothetical protein
MPRHEENPGKPERAQERRVQALDLRIRGLSFRRIGEKLGISHTAAHKAVERALSDLAKLEGEKAEVQRQLDLERVNKIILSLWPKKGDPKAAAALLKAMERRAKLLGLDMPKGLNIGTLEGEPFKVYLGVNVEEV